MFKGFLISFLIGLSYCFVYAQQQPFTTMAQLIMQHNNADYAENILYRLGIPVTEELSDTRFATAFEGLDSNNMPYAVKLQKFDDSNEFLYLAFVVDSCYYDNIIEDLHRKGYVKKLQDREDCFEMGYRDGLDHKIEHYKIMAKQEIFSTPNIMCVVQTGNDYLQKYVYIYYTYRRDHKNVLLKTAEDVKVIDFNEIFDPNNEGDTDWNFTEIEPDWLSSMGIYFDEERRNFFEYAPFFKLRKSNLSKIEGFTSYPFEVQKDAVSNTLYPIRKLNSSRDHILSYINGLTNPHYPGGEEAMIKYIKNELKIPKKEKAKGRVRVIFQIDELGKVINVHLDKSLSEKIDDEIKRVFYSMPMWEPATFDDVPTKSGRMSFPITIVNN